jgi:hypothetical protein
MLFTLMTNATNAEDILSSPQTGAHYRNFETKSQNALFSFMMATLQDFGHFE